MAGYSAEWIKIPDGNGGLTKFWLRDSEARRQVAGKQDTLSQTQLDAVNSGITAAKVTAYDEATTRTAVSVAAGLTETYDIDTASITRILIVGNDTAAGLCGIYLLAGNAVIPVTAAADLTIAYTTGTTLSVTNNDAAETASGVII